MVATIERRLERLEQTIGDSPCKRCNNTTVVIDCFGTVSVNKNGTHLTPDAAKAFHREEQPHGQCPACGNFRHKVRVGWGPRR